MVILWDGKKLALEAMSSGMRMDVCHYCNRLECDGIFIAMYTCNRICKIIFFRKRIKRKISVHIMCGCRVCPFANVTAVNCRSAAEEHVQYSTNRLKSI